MIILLVLFALIFNAAGENLSGLPTRREGSGSAKPVLYRQIQVPAPLLQRQDGLTFGGDIRMGDLNGNGQADFLVYRAAGGHPEGATKPCFLGAFTQDGEILWKKGEGGTQPNRPGPVAIHDIDGDGQSEVVCFFTSDTCDPDPFRMQGITMQILDGLTGRVEREANSPVLDTIRGSGPNWVHMRILVASFRKPGKTQDFVIKLGKNLIAFDKKLKMRWTYYNPWDQYQECPSYIPTVGDMDGDGLDEVFGGYYLLDHDGTVLWQKKLGRNMDAVSITAWDNGSIRAVGSGYGHVLDRQGHTILLLGEALVPHGQELRVADFVATMPGPEMLIRYNGHTPEVMLVDNRGTVRRRFTINESPNNTGMTTVYWHGAAGPALLFNGGMLWTGMGERFARLPGLPAETGNKRQGWYHCIPADVCGDEREEVVTYNPWDQFIFIFTPDPLLEDTYGGYRAGPRQYNARLMD